MQVRFYNGDHKAIITIKASQALLFCACAGVHAGAVQLAACAGRRTW